MIEELLPAALETADSFGDGEEPAAHLFPEERRIIESAVDKRRREFATVRGCARAALARLGVPAAPILPGRRGAPGWPEGIVGSMTHCDGYRAAAVGHAADVATVGLDAEPHLPLPDPDVARMVTVPEERTILASLAARHPEVCWDRLLFSAKESVYKAWFPLTGRWLDFSEAAVELLPDGTFHARLLVPGPEVDGTRLDGFAGRWLVRDGLLLTAIALPRS